MGRGESGERNLGVPQWCCQLLNQPCHSVLPLDFRAGETSIPMAGAPSAGFSAAGKTQKYLNGDRLRNQVLPPGSMLTSLVPTLSSLGLC